ncbi:MAG: pyridoxal-phosphate dependent enzyme [Chloroflexi bacterium]|nr:pyridoxal-phosphate dependent enzyme [Chloroflexota bacterium]
MADTIAAASTTWTPDALAERLATLPRMSIAALPTPLDEAPRLSAALGGPRILVKRDDLTGLALGGNKVRHLEFRVADALARGATCLVAMNVAQSNHARLHAAVAARFGLKMYILRPGPVDAPVQGNLLLDHLFGATIIPLGEIGTAEREARLTAFLAELTARGERPYPVIRGANPSGYFLGVAAYLNAGLELLGQLQARRLTADHIFLIGGSSAAGLALAGKLLGAPWRVHAISNGGNRDQMWRSISDVATGGAAVANVPVTLEPGDLDIHDDYVGPGYGIATDAAVEAMQLAARTEGLILDPVYTGKALAGLIGETRAGRIGPHQTAIFIHSGGIPITFAYSEEILARL